MQYASGKKRISKPIKEVILNEVCKWKEQNFKTNMLSNFNTHTHTHCSLVSLFCGTCSVESKLAPYFDNVICNDKQEYLIALFNGVKNGYELPDYVSEEEYKYIRNNKDEDKILTGFVAFGCSFGGKFFGGYARNKNKSNYADMSKRSLLKDMNTLMNAEFISKDYRDVVLPENCAIYADPPYRNTTTSGYGLKEKFDNDAFWEYARSTSETHLMFISEQEAPDDFKSIWEKPFTRQLDRNKDNLFKVTEKLFLHKKWVNQ